MIATASALAAAGAGTVSARSSPELNADSDLTPIPRAETTVELEEVEIGGSPLAFIEDDGSDSSLSSYAGEVTSRPTDEDGDEEPHNPFTLRADRIVTEEYTDFPRGETYDDGDDEDAEVSALDAEHWTEVDGEVTVSDESPASGGSGLRFTSEGVADGTEAVATFSHVDITSGVPRKEFQLVVSIDQLDGTAEVRVGDGETWAVAEIDPAADPDEDSTIATSTGDSVVYQASVGDLEGDLDAIETIEIAAIDDDVDLLVAGLNLDRESQWSFGSREVWDDEDEEIETEEWIDPVGEFSIAEFDDLDDVFSGAQINPLEVDVEYYPTSTDYEVGDASNPAYDEALEIVDNIEVPSAYSVSHGSIDVRLELGMSPDQWSDLEAATGLSDPIELEDVDDEVFTDYSSELDTAEVEDDVELGVATSGEIVAVRQEIDVLSDQLAEIESSGEVTGFFGGGGGGGILSTPMGIVATIGSGLATYLAITRGWLSGLLGGS